MILVLAGCATSFEVEVDYDPAKDFSALRQYAWYHSVSAPGQVAENRIRTAVEFVLYRQGYRYVEPGGEPDFRVSFTAVAESELPADEVSSRQAYDPGTWRPAGSGRSTGQKYTRGTLIIDIIDPVEGSLLWRGVSSRSLEKGRMQSEREEDLLEIVRAILKQFPPQPE